MIDNDSLHEIQNGGSSRFSKNAWVRNECPIRIRDKTTSSLRLYWMLLIQLFISGWTECNLLDVLRSQEVCHVDSINLLTIGLKSENGILTLAGVKS